MPPSGCLLAGVNNRNISGLWLVAPEGRKNIAPAGRPGTKAANVRGPEGRKINATNLSPGLVFRRVLNPGLRPGPGSNAPPGLFIHAFI